MIHFIIKWFKGNKVSERKSVSCKYIFNSKCGLGAFNNNVDRILPFLTPCAPPPPLCGDNLYPERGQKQTFFDPLPPLILST
jgi:hypothetical protein